MISCGTAGSVERRGNRTKTVLARKRTRFSLRRARNSSISRCKSDFFGLLLIYKLSRSDANERWPICTNRETERVTPFKREAVRARCTGVVATRFLSQRLIKRQGTMYCGPRDGCLDVFASNFGRVRISLSLYFAAACKSSVEFFYLARLGVLCFVCTYVHTRCLPGTQ